MKSVINRSKTNFIFFLLILVYILVYVFFVLNNLLKYAECISAAFSIVLFFLALLFYGFRKIYLTNKKKEVIRLVLISISAYFLVTYFFGLAIGYLNNSYSLGFLAILNNALFQFVFIVFIELFRYIFISSNKDKIGSIYVLTILLTVLEIFSFSFISYDSNIEVIFNLIILTILPKLLNNIMASYVCYKTDFIAPLLFSLIINLYIFMVPIVPNLSELMESISNLVLPFGIIFWTSKVMNDTTSETENNKVVKKSDLVYLGIFVILFFLVSGIGPFKIIGIETGSMTPSINIGDAVIINKNFDYDKLKEDDVIAYLDEDGRVIIHRIINVNSDGSFVTKGDYNNSKDPKFVYKKDVQGKVVFKVPFIAYPSVIINKEK